jgi:hypothetical protein
VNRFVPVKAIAAKGEARMKGTSMSEVGVGGIGKNLGDCWTKGRTEKRVRSRVRPIASGTARRSSMKRVGLGGMSL